MFPHDITVYRKENDEWHSYQVFKVLWQDTEAVNIIKSGLKDANSLTLYIPFSCEFEPKKKDVIVFGLINYKINRSSSELLNQDFKARTVTTVDAFNFGGLKHYKVGGK